MTGARAYDFVQARHHLAVDGDFHVRQVRERICALCDKSALLIICAAL
jgi:hypothetical protein